MKLVVYTALFGPLDSPLSQIGELAPPMVNEEDVTYIAFTNRKDIVSSFWDVRHIELRESSPRVDARYYKLNSHKVLGPHDYSIWMDHQFRFLRPPWQIIEKYLLDTGADIALHHHADLNNLATEAALQCWEHHNDDPSIIMEQMVRYGNAGFPMLGYDHFETGALLRRNTHPTREFNEMWWSELQQGSLRDQLSAPYVIWKCRQKDFKIATILETFTAHAHRLNIPQSQSFFTIPKPAQPEDVTQRATHREA